MAGTYAQQSRIFSERQTSVTQLSSLGLVEMTRKRTRESLEHILCESCPTCEGRGYIKTATTVCYEIFREILRESRQFDARELLVLASQNVTDLLLDEESDSLAELQEFIGVPIRFQPESLYTQEQFDVVFLDPPFNSNILQQALLILIERKLLAPSSGLVYIESSAQSTRPQCLDEFSSILSSVSTVDLVN